MPHLADARTSANELGHTVNPAEVLATAGSITVVASFSYDSLGNRTGLSLLDGSGVSYGDDPISRLTSLAHNFVGSTNNLTKTFAYDPASRIASETRSNDNYAWNGAVNVARPYTANGLNQYTAAGAASFTYDANGNLTNDGSNAFVYDSQNKLTSVSGAHNATLTYDPLGNLTGVDSSSQRRFVYNGDQLVAEVNMSGTVLSRYVFGPGVDEPLLWWDYGSGVVRSLHADERGSIVAVGNGYGVPSTINSYDEYGIPGSGNSGAFQYTGQVYLPEIGLYYYKARMYSPTGGRFMQTDPIGYGDGMNIYAYTHNDPVNGTDPTGTVAPIVVIGIRLAPVIAPQVVAAVVGVASVIGSIFSGIFGGGHAAVKVQAHNNSPHAKPQNNGIRSCAPQSARMLQGNTDLIGKPGGFSGNKIIPVTNHSAAIIPSEFGMTKAQLRPYLGRISGSINGVTVFTGVTDILDNAIPPRGTPPGMSTAQGFEHLNPGSIIIEVVGAPDRGVVPNLMISAPSQVNCPTAP